MPSVDLNAKPAEFSSDKKVNLDFGDQRRYSFLPDSWSEKAKTSIKNIRILEVNEDDNLYMYMSANAHLFQERPLEKFCTGSKYMGQWNNLGIAGKGVYKFPHGVIYDGYFNRNGQFHGTGILVYPSGQRIEGMWKNGKLEPNCNFVAKGGVVMSKHYCQMPDRRFQIECEQDFNPAGQEYLTNEEPPPREIPEGCYDMVEGFFDANLKTIVAFPKQQKTPASESHSKLLSSRSSTRYLFSGDDQRKGHFAAITSHTPSEKELQGLMQRDTITQKRQVLWIPSPAQEEWITKNCRRGWDEATEYKPEYYEEWTKGGLSSRTGEQLGELDDKEEGVLRQSDLMTLEEGDSRDRRFVSFIQSKDQHESLTVDGLLKMFFKSEDQQILTNR